ncbi:Ger(x)C family spore germination protein [Bacillus luteolus]|uniref:Ger(X)C family spore germination protein n=1 Tax=Litchfieldia luteola TaxID=682179 RepID=A0ABR9QIZ8_9BACI|nr:Ger(x)C family spore germination protein [Cytobacillus luteolus]MBE4908466.1 Ger(x)C family spore germination protein [Cytobacillus luteolus]MBP1941317.1 spore germination protein [Cytobacillus luteolus]
MSVYRFFFLVFILFLTGCSDQHILEDLGMIHTVTYDLADDGEKYSKNPKLKVSVSIPVTSERVKEDRELLVTTAASSKDARSKFAAMTNRQIVSGQLQNSLFGEALAKGGLWPHIDTLVRDPAIGQTVRLIIANQDAYEVVNQHYKARPRTGDYISNLLEQSVNGNAIPRVTVYHFTRDYFDDGIDPVMPMLKNEGDNIVVAGIALFQDDKYITKISPEKGTLFVLSYKDISGGNLNIKLNEGEENQELVMLTAVIGNRKIRAKKIQDRHYEVSLTLEVEGSVLEYIGDKTISDDKDRAKLEEDLSYYVKTEVGKLIATMQENKVDSIGIGKFVRNAITYEEWKSLDWHEVFPTVKVNTEAKVVIKEIGKFK